MAASTSGAASVFDVALVPPGSGGELRLRLQVALDGVHLFQPDGQASSRCHRNFIHRPGLPSSAVVLQGG